MLSEQEQRTLEGIESHFGTEDSDLAQRSRAGAPPPQQPPRWLYTVGLVLALVVLAVCSILALPVAVVQSAALATGLAAIRRVQSAHTSDWM